MKESVVKTVKIKISKTIFGICFFFIEILSYGQCAMCRASLESEGNVEKAQSVNNGIVYLMSFPYILAAVMGYVIYRMYAKRKRA
jgi:hypothetical protein